MAQQNQNSTAKAQAIAAKENSQAVAVHALLITGAVLGGLLTLAQIIL